MALFCNFELVAFEYCTVVRVQRDVVSISYNVDFLNIKSSITFHGKIGLDNISTLYSNAFSSSVTYTTVQSITVDVLNVLLKINCIK